MPLFFFPSIIYLPSEIGALFYGPCVSDLLVLPCRRACIMTVKLGIFYVPLQASVIVHSVTWRTLSCAVGRPTYFFCATWLQLFQRDLVAWNISILIYNMRIGTKIHIVHSILLLYNCILCINMSGMHGACQGESFPMYSGNGELTAAQWENYSEYG